VHDQFESLCKQRSHHERQLFGGRIALGLSDEVEAI